MTRKLDALVAEKVMGRTVYMADTGGMERDPLLSDVRRPGDRTVPEFSTDIAAAWQVVEKMLPTLSDFGVSYVLDEWVCSHWGGSGGWRTITANTAPLAICKAALRAVGVAQDEINAAMESTE